MALSSLTPRVLNARLKGYKWILAGQTTVMFNFLFFHELLHQHPFPYWRELLLGVTGFLLLFMNYLSYELISDLTDNKFLQRFVLILLCMGVILGTITGMNIIPDDHSSYRFFLFLSSAVSLLSFIILFYMMIYDIFNEKHDITYRLWGSACIYLGIGATFGLFYSTLEILLPGEFGANSSLDVFHLIRCYNFSFYTLAGMQSPYAGFSQLVNNVAVIEAIFSNLFIVLIVGRLLSK